MDFFGIHIGKNNYLLTGGVVDVRSPNDATVMCTFLCEFNGSAHCTVQYGTDPTYMNLPYSAESNETGTAGDTVSVVLREQLNSSTVYYYTVSAVSDVTVTVRGTFATPQYSVSKLSSKSKLLPCRKYYTFVRCPTSCQELCKVVHYSLG